MKTIKGNKLRSVLMLLTLPILPVLLIPVTKAAMDSGHSEMPNSAWYITSAAKPVSAPSRVAVSVAVQNAEKTTTEETKPAAAAEGTAETPTVEEPKLAAEKGLQAHETFGEDQSGNIVRETFDANGRRVTKSIISQDGVLLNRWHFNPIDARILRYEVNTYQEGVLSEHRVARWAYNGQNGFVKTNRIFDAANKPINKYVEYVNAKGVKYQERWYDSKERILSEKRWNPESGQFSSGFEVTYLPGGWSKRQYQDTRGHTFREVLFTPKGKVFKLGGMIFGKQR